MVIQPNRHKLIVTRGLLARTYFMKKKTNYYMSSLKEVYL